MKKILTIFILGIFLIGLVSAQVNEIDAGITPDSPFWGLDKLGEQLRYSFTFNKENRAMYSLQIADERLAEIREMDELDLKEQVIKAENQRMFILERFEGNLEDNGTPLTLEQRNRIQQRLQLHLNEETKLITQLRTQTQLKTNSELKEKVRGN